METYNILDNIKPNNYSNNLEISLEECSICYEDIEEKDKKILNCGHIFHNKCINNWIKINPICPYCRNYIINSFECIFKQKLFSNKCKIILDEAKFSNIIIKNYLPIINTVYKEIIIPTEFIKSVQNKNKLVIIEFRKEDTNKIEKYTFKFLNINASYQFCDVMKNYFINYTYLIKLNS